MKITILIILVFIASPFLVNACVCNRGDACCCPQGWSCCNEPGKCCCSSQFEEKVWSVTHKLQASEENPQISQQRNLMEKLESARNLQLHCSPDCWLGNLCGSACECIWPNCILKSTHLENNQTTNAGCLSPGNQCRVSEDCCSGFCVFQTPTIGKCW